MHAYLYLLRICQEAARIDLQNLSSVDPNLTFWSEDGKGWGMNCAAIVLANPALEDESWTACSRRARQTECFDHRRPDAWVKRASSVELGAMTTAGGSTSLGVLGSVEQEQKLPQSRSSESRTVRFAVRV
jgi:hypothetical protein